MNQAKNGKKKVREQREIVAAKLKSIEWQYYEKIENGNTLPSSLWVQTYCDTDCKTGIKRFKRFKGALFHFETEDKWAEIVLFLQSVVNYHITHPQEKFSTEELPITNQLDKERKQSILIHSLFLEKRQIINERGNFVKKRGETPPSLLQESLFCVSKYQKMITNTQTRTYPILKLYFKAKWIGEGKLPSSQKGNNITLAEFREETSPTQEDAKGPSEESITEESEDLITTSKKKRKQPRRAELSEETSPPLRKMQNKTSAEAFILEKSEDVIRTLRKKGKQNDPIKSNTWTLSRIRESKWLPIVSDVVWVTYASAYWPAKVQFH